MYDVSDAFFSGELLRGDEWIFVKLPTDVLPWEKEDETRPFRRLLPEVPGCKGASSSWFRTLAKKDDKLGVESNFRRFGAIYST